MTETPNNEKQDDSNVFTEELSAKVARKLKAQRNPTPGVWFGLGMAGLIGWSVVVPTLIGAAFGIWLDNHYSGSRSWTLMMLIAGLSVGCLNAWRWVTMQDEEMRRELED
jgi:ATP synthase protein I